MKTWLSLLNVHLRDGTTVSAGCSDESLVSLPLRTYWLLVCSTTGVLQMALPPLHRSGRKSSSYSAGSAGFELRALRLSAQLPGFGDCRCFYARKT